ncbi:DUF155-domain-containing protein [Cristinia sonorae]|uniref:DUF155-domain-containing protein n=1 Tax=Cristinia sonorae TaxID=1940300 RepID=A0A8K0URV7_9AGAR|nr:DUF155-domain-containing protein [Cristinia sonorae]
MASNHPQAPQSADQKARGANRSTKVAGKLKVLPDQPEPFVVDKPVSLPPPPKVTSQGEGSGVTGDSDEDEADDEEDTEDVEFYNQIDLIPEGTARRDALRLTKKKAKQLPRVTAYATCTSFRFPELMKFFNARRTSYHTNPRIIDDVIYTPYVYEPPTSSNQRHVHFQSQAGTSESEPHPPPPTGDLLGAEDLAPPRSADPIAHDGAAYGTFRKKNKFQEVPTQAEIFLFQYGTVVIWGMTEAQEKRFLSSIKRFEIEKLGPDDVEMEDLNYYYANYSRIYNDVITLRRGSSYMTKLSLSHALSQSVKISLFEELISSTIDETKDIPEIISETGKIGIPHKGSYIDLPSSAPSRSNKPYPITSLLLEIMRKIGELFLLRTNINSVGSVLDSPEVFWTYPDLQPLYDAARSYLEIPQRINLLNTRVEVLQDMLQLLKETVSSRHSERLEQIVIALIGVEIVLGIITIIVDVFS